MSIRLLLIDDNVLFRKGVSMLLSQQDGVRMIGDLGSNKALDIDAWLQDADLVLMDVQLPEGNPMDLIAHIKQGYPSLGILALTHARDEELVSTALRVGVDGYVLKDATLEELLIAIRSVAKGKKYLSPDISGHLVESYLHADVLPPKASLLDLLTTRERGILQLIAQGQTNKGAAAVLSVSPKTVEKHRASLMHKLGVRNATEMTLAAMELGLIERPSSVTRRMDRTPTLPSPR